MCESITRYIDSTLFSLHEIALLADSFFIDANPRLRRTSPLHICVLVMLLVANPHALVLVLPAVFCVSVSSFALFHAILPLSFECVSIAVTDHSMTMEFSLDPITLVLGSVRPSVRALPVLKVIDEVTVIDCLAFVQFDVPYLTALSIALVVFPLAFVVTVIDYAFHFAIALFLVICHIAFII